MKDLYSKYGEHFAGATLALQKQIAELKDELKERDNEIARLNITIQHKDELHETEVQCYKKDIEIWKLKHQLETMSNATASK